jgi:NAD(P)-dependent dehydrogenase (short-subunit alcohol dehydrogenase family)
MRNEGAIPEIGKFGIEVTLVEPGTARTNIMRSSDGAPPVEIYQDTPVGDFRRAIALHGEKILIGDQVQDGASRITGMVLEWIGASTCSGDCRVSSPIPTSGYRVEQKAPDDAGA